MRARTPTPRLAARAPRFGMREAENRRVEVILR